MELPSNPLKRALREGWPQVDLWTQLVHAQLQALASGSAAPLIRQVWNEAVVFKRLFDVGVQNLLVPFVRSMSPARLRAIGCRARATV